MLRATWADGFCARSCVVFCLVQREAGGKNAYVLHTLPLFFFLAFFFGEIDARDAGRTHPSATYHRRNKKQNAITYVRTSRNLKSTDTPPASDRCDSRRPSPCCTERRCRRLQWPTIRKFPHNERTPETVAGDGRAGGGAECLQPHNRKPSWFTVLNEQWIAAHLSIVTTLFLAISRRIIYTKNISILPAAEDSRLKPVVSVISVRFCRFGVRSRVVMYLSDSS